MHESVFFVVLVVQSKVLWKLLSLGFLLKVFEVIKKQEDTKQAELAAKVAEFKEIQAQHETVSGSWIP